MNKDLLHTGVQEFIKKNINTEITSILLKKSTFPNVSPKELAEQIEAKKKCKTKLPKWYETSKIYYPNKLNIEQTSSEKTAEYKTSILTGTSVIDITGGFGIDCYYFSSKMKTVFHCEINKQLSSIASYNLNILNAKNIKTIPLDGIEYLKNKASNFDWIYIDPSRRNDSKGKVFMLSDCLPDVPLHLDFFFRKSKNILIKTSPLLDFSIGISELKNVKEIHVVALENEVKELLWVLEKNYSGNISVIAVNISKKKQDLFSYILEEEKENKAKFSLPLKYLYEPNASILKSGAFKTLSKQLDLSKLHTNTHLYTHTTLLNFPGRIFNIDSIIPYNKRAIKKLGIKKANITIRNFPENVADIRKKHKIKEGGSIYLFFIRNLEDALTVLLCSKVASLKN
ncbi:class I SAM-dependent methyltransferase [uncultured Maribacter sp.]|uniref:THUMP-like domain-containing protein n=1 Tax=uncultured Maribacter sp. TaxID=431308 RepID=UPI002611D91D|nr:class I SAM-dependent methyltransferase [uncultured Maribacter sp.]